MYLILTPSSEGVAIAAYNDHHLLQQERYVQVRGRGHRSIVGSLLALVTELHTTLPKLAGIAVVQGAGTFTTLRQAISVANTLHWLYEVPLGTLNHTRQGIPRFAARLLTPKYSGKPNITQKKIQK